MSNNLKRDHLELDYATPGSIRAEDVPYDAGKSIKDELDLKGTEAQQSTNTGNISTNTGGVAANLAAILSNDGELADHESRIAVLEGAGGGDLLHSTEITVASPTVEFPNDYSGEGALSFNLQEVVCDVPGDIIYLQFNDGVSWVNTGYTFIC